MSIKLQLFRNFQWSQITCGLIVLLGKKWDVYDLCYVYLVVIWKSARRRMACVIMISFSFLLFKLFPFIECCSTGYHLTIKYDWVKYFISNKIKINSNIHFNWMKNYFAWYLIYFLGNHVDTNMRKRILYSNQIEYF